MRNSDRVCLEFSYSGQELLDIPPLSLVDGTSAQPSSIAVKRVGRGLAASNWSPYVGSEPQIKSLRRMYLWPKVAGAVISLLSATLLAANVIVLMFDLGSFNDLVAMFAGLFLIGLAVQLVAGLSRYPRLASDGRVIIADVPLSVGEEWVHRNPGQVSLASGSKALRSEFAQSALCLIVGIMSSGMGLLSVVH